MRAKAWFKVKYVDDKNEQVAMAYHYAESMQDVIDLTRNAPPDIIRLVEGCSPLEVSAILRGLKEASTEELRHELKSRGWKVSLS
jgi:hypothetical protein